MERIKYLVIPFFFNLGAMVLTEYIIRKGVGFESNPVAAFFFNWSGTFLFMPILGALIIFLAMPKFIDWLIGKVKDGENYRPFFEWLLISTAIIMTSVDFFNDFLILLNVR